MATREQARSPLGISVPDRYQLVRPVATGGMASVWCAQDRLLGRVVAIKLMADRLAGDDTAVRRFKREARAAARLSDHPNVVTIYDVGQARPGPEAPSGRPFIVMERLRGGTVADALRAAQLQPDRALEWLRQAAAAVDYAHGRGVIHRDIKPSNFLLDDARVLHVGDFGIALVATEDTLTASGQLFGTAAYLAPEVALGEPATEASDRYALAVAAFELLTGQRPFTAAHFAAQARQHIDSPPPRASLRNPGLPEAIDPVLQRGMAKRPQDRFASAEELVYAIEAGLRGARTAPAPATAQTRPLPRRAAGAPPAPRRLRPRAAALAALAALLIGVAIAVAEAGGGGQRSPALSRAGSAPPATHSPATAAVHRAKPAPAAPAPPPSADALEARGHQLMLSGDYQHAIPVLRQAVAAAPHGSLTYAYALYDLGRSLRLAGDPQAAIPILQQRLQIPDQTGVVKQELALAQQAAGQGGAPNPGGKAKPGPAPPPGPGKGHGHKHGDGGGGDGGD